MNRTTTITCSLLFLAAGALAAPGLLAPASEALSAPSGRYLEARTASVFAGACHFGGERSEHGRTAVLAWSIERGGSEGEDLAGLAACALVTSAENLADGAARRSVLYLPETAVGARGEALERWVRDHCAAVLGDVREVRRGKLELAFDGDAYRLGAHDGTLTLEGALLPNRDCCRMPFDVWYPSLVDVDEPIVGQSRVFRVREASLDLAFARFEENDAFVGGFGATAASGMAAN